MKPHAKDPSYELEQGFINPRNPNEIGWRTFGAYQTLAQAKQEAKETFKGRGLWRIRECSNVDVSEEYNTAMGKEG